MITREHKHTRDVIQRIAKRMNIEVDWDLTSVGGIYGNPSLLWKAIVEIREENKLLREYLGVELVEEGKRIVKKTK